LSNYTHTYKYVYTSIEEGGKSDYKPSTACFSKQYLHMSSYTTHVTCKSHCTHPQDMPYITPSVSSAKFCHTSSETCAAQTVVRNITAFQSTGHWLAKQDPIATFAAFQCCCCDGDTRLISTLRTCCLRLCRTRSRLPFLFFAWTQPRLPPPRQQFF
jgi:hypothetical protein